MYTKEWIFFNSLYFSFSYQFYLGNKNKDSLDLKRVDGLIFMPEMTPSFRTKEREKGQTSVLKNCQYFISFRSPPTVGFSLTTKINEIRETSNLPLSTLFDVVIVHFFYPFASLISYQKSTKLYCLIITD